MAKANVIHTNFTSGEVSPLLLGRSDSVKYANGAKRVRNMIIRPQGAAQRRTGFQYLSSCPTPSTVSRLVPFEYGNTTAYIIEFSALKARILTDSGPVTDSSTSKNINDITNSGGLALVQTTAAHSYSTGDMVTIASSDVSVYNGEWQITVTAADLFTLNHSIFTTNAGTVGTSVKHVMVTTPYAAADLAALDWAQSADILFLAHPSYAPRQLNRVSATSWTMTEFNFVDGPYMDYNRSDIRLTVTNIQDACLMTGNAAFVAAAPFVQATDAGDFIEFFDGYDWKLARINSVSSTSVASVNILDNRTLTNLDPSIRLTQKQNEVARGYDGARQYGTPYVNPLTYDRVYRPGSNNQYERPTNPAGVPRANVPPGVAPEGLDPSATLAESGGTITSSHSATFTKADVGKYVRTAKDTWWQITAIGTGGATATVSAATMKTYASGEVTIDPATRTMSCTITAASSIFVSTDSGRHLRMNFQGRQVYAKLALYMNGLEMTASLYDDFPLNLRDASQLANNGRTLIWRFGAWSGTTGYPSKVAFHEQRLWFAATTSEPQRLWASRPGDFNKFSPTEADSSALEDNAINVGLASSEVNAINWMVSGKVLMVGSNGGEWQIRAASSMNEPMSPTNIVASPETNHGSISNAKALKVGHAVLFLQRSGQELREIRYSFEDDSWVSRDLTVISEHIFREGTSAAEMVYQKRPHSIVWVRLSNGDLAALTYVREQEVFAWSYHTVGGSGVVESIATTVASSGTTNILYAIVRRTINATTRRYIEKLAVDHYPADSTTATKNAMRYLDSHATYTGSATTTPTGWAHLEGATVDVMADGVNIGTKTVLNGGFTLSVAASSVTAGFAYTSDLQMVSLEGGSPFGTSQAKTGRIPEVAVRVFNSIGVKMGQTTSDLAYREFDSGNYATGDYSYPLGSDYNRDKGFYLRQDKPHPLVVLAVYPVQHKDE